MSRRWAISLAVCGLWWAAAWCHAARVDIRIPTRDIAPQPGGQTAVSDIDLNQRPITARVSPSDILLVEQTDAATLKVEALLENGRTVDVTASTGTRYSVHTSGIVSVSIVGVVTSIASGDTEIFADHLGEIGSARVMVRLGGIPASLSVMFDISDDPEISDAISFSTSAVLSPGETTQADAIAVLVTGEQGLVSANTSVLFESLDPGVATISSRGLVKAVALGTARIRATFGTLSAEGRVTVLQSDITPPVSSTIFSGPQFFDGSRFFVSTNTTLTLSAFDPVVSSQIVSGVEFLGFAVDASAAGVEDLVGFIDPFTLREGSHTIVFGSGDNALNLEVFHSTAILVDATAPASRLEVFGSSTTDAFGMLVIPSGSLVGFEAADPVSNGVASGVKEIRYSLDGGVEQVFAGPFALSSGTHRIEFFGLDNVGNMEPRKVLEIFSGTPTPPDPKLHPFFEFSFKFGQPGSGTGALNVPSDVDVDGEGNLYIIDFTAKRIQKYSPDGQFLKAWSQSAGIPSGIPYGLGVDPLNRRVAVTDNENNPADYIVRVFDLDGNFLFKIGPMVGGSRLFLASDVAFDGLGNIYITDLSPLVYKLDSQGTLIKRWSVAGVPRRLSIDRQNNIYVTSGGDEKVQKFSSEGVLLAQWGSPGSLPGQFGGITGIGTDFHGNVYTMESSRVQIFTGTGSFITQFGQSGSQDGQFNIPWGVAASQVNGRVYVADLGNKRVQVFGMDFTPPGVPVILNPAANATVAVSTPLVLGRAEAGSTVELFIDGLLSVSTLVPADGTFRIRSVNLLSAGSHVISARARDTAGNQSALSSGISVTVRTLTPAAFLVPQIFEAQNTALASRVTVTADFNRDGHRDIFAVGIQSYAIYLGLGNGTFQQQAVQTVFSNVASDALVTDLNKDGNSDVIIVANNVISALLGTDKGTLQPPINTASHLLISTPGHLEIASGDFNEDGREDVVVSNGDVFFLPGLGDGRFGSSQLIATRSLVPFPRGIETADFNKDGHLDFVSDSVVYFGDGSGNFPTTLSLADGSRVPTTTDFNQDGNPDIVSFSGNALFLQAGLGDGTFVLVSTDPAPSSIISSLHADFNMDGIEDFIVGTAGDLMAVFLGRGDGTFSSGPTLRTGRASIVSNMSVDDLNHNRTLDVIAALNINSLGNEFAVFFNTTTGHDFVPPGSVANLSAQNTTEGDVLLTWTAPGDDGSLGQAQSYDLRFSSVALNAATFAQANFVARLASPQAAGSSETFLLSGLSGGTTFLFALKSLDEAGNISAISNIAGIETPFVSRSTTMIEGKPELIFVSQQVNTIALVSGGSPDGAVVLATAGAQGFVLIGNLYDLGPENFPFAPPATIVFRYSAQTVALLGIADQDIALYQFVPGTGLVRVAGQVLDTQNKTVTVAVSSIASIFGLFGPLPDRLAPRTQIAVGPPRFGQDPVFVTSGTVFSFTAADDLLIPGDARGSGIRETRFALDTAAFGIFSSSFSVAGEGSHFIRFFSIDVAGNQEPVNASTVAVDNTAPLSRIVVSSPTFVDASGAISLSTRSFLGFEADDPVSGGVAVGVSSTEFRLDGGAFQEFVSTFSPAVGTHRVEFRSRDRLGNLETLRTGTVTVDGAPPAISISSPSGGEIFIAGRGEMRVAFSVRDDFDPAPVVSAFLVQLEDRGSPRGLKPSLTPVATGQILDPLSIDDGLWQLKVTATDFVLNSTVAFSGVFEVVHDTMPPRTALSISTPQAAGEAGVTFVTKRTDLNLSSIDDLIVPSDGLGLGVAFQQLSVDGVLRSSFTNPSPAPGQVFSSSFTLSADPEGIRVLSYFAEDIPANRESVRIATVAVDNTPPESRLDVGAPKAALADGSMLVSGRTSFIVVSTDPVSSGVASGLRDSFVAIDTGPFLQSTTFFALTPPDGSRVIGFFARDNVLNTEVAKSATVILDAVPPIALLLSPSPEARGMDQVFGKGIVPVVATVSEIHFRSFLLESAPGKDATGGFATISFGTEAVSQGVIARWDTSALSGFLTLRLTATDLVENVAVATATVFIGDPTLLLALENAPDGKGLLKKPEGVAVDFQGNIYVANTGRDQVLKFGATGQLLLNFDGLTTLISPKPKKNEKDDQDEPRTITFNKPIGLALDQAGNLFVADRNNNRIAVLSSTGAVIRSVGRTNPEGRFIPGKGPGEFNKPTGVAVSTSRIVVADRNNERAQVFDAAFSFLFEIRMDQVAPAPLEPSDEDDDEDGEKDADEVSKPFGVALDPAGNIYVTDEESGRILALDPQGKLLFSLGREGELLGQFENPKGIASSVLKYLYAADRGNKRVQKIDPFQNPVLAFGAAFGLRQPVGIALDGLVNLYVTDRDTDRVLKFGLPDGTLVVSLPPVLKVKKGRIGSPGGKVARADRVTVDVPAGALASELEISIEPETTADPEEESRKKRAKDEKRLAAVSEGVEYGPHGTIFNAPVTITLVYDPKSLPPGVREDELKVHYWNPRTSTWEALSSTVDRELRTVSAKTLHFSLYQVMAMAPGVGIAALPLAADPSFGLKAAYAFPNPVRGQNSVVIRVQPGVADSVTVRVYDVAGRKVHESANFTDRGAFDDGNGNGQQFTYDHVWDISGVGSGVYTYAVTARKAGQSDISKIGKIGIVK